MAEEFCVPALMANAKYEGKYPLVSALSRPVIVKHLVAEARRHGATAVAHGCTGKGNDQVRFEVGTRALAPDLEVLAPARLWGLTRDDSIEYAAKWDIPLSVTKEKPYSIDENLWGRAIECGIIEDPWNRPPEDVYSMTRPTATEPTEVVIGFESGRAGVPRRADPAARAADRRDEPVGRLLRLRAARHGREPAGRHQEPRDLRVPGALALLLAHADLEDLTLERDLQHEKLRLEPRWSELVYDGLWFSPLKQALDAFFLESQRHVTGEVRLRLRRRAVLGGRPAQPGRASTTTAWPPTTPPTPSGTRTPRASCACGASAWPPGRRSRPGSRDGAGDRPATAMTLWHGRFGGGTADAVMEYSVSLHYDRRLAVDDLAGSRAHVRGLGRGGLLDDGRGGGPAGRPRPGRGRAGRRDRSSSRRATRTSTPRSSGG